MTTLAPTRPFKVLYHIHPKFDPMDLIGPYEVFTWGRQENSDPAHVEFVLPGFTNTITGGSSSQTTHSNMVVNIHIPISEAYATLADYDILVIPGGGSEVVLTTKAEPISLIKAFAALPKRKDGGVRTLLSVCTGALMVGEAGVLAGKSATTHPFYSHVLKAIIEPQGGKVLHGERFVANPVNEEKGLRIVTAGGVSAGMDAALFLVGELMGEGSKKQAAHTVQYNLRDGVVL